MIDNPALETPLPCRGSPGRTRPRYHPDRLPHLVPLPREQGPVPGQNSTRPSLLADDPRERGTWEAEGGRVRPRLPEFPAKGFRDQRTAERGHVLEKGREKITKESTFGLGAKTTRLIQRRRPAPPR